MAAGRFADGGVGLERRDRSLDVTGGQRALVLTDDIGFVQVGVGLKQRRSDRVAAGERPRAVGVPAAPERSEP
jgi:hypothetical protein